MMKNAGMRAFFEILSPSADKPRTRDKAVMYSCLACDAGAQLETPFLTMLMLEDTFAYAQAPFGIC